jgi:hypothetical protein
MAVKTVGLTYDLKTDYKFKEGDPLDANAEFDHPTTIDVISKAIAANGFKVKKIGNAVNLMEQLDNLGVDIVFNISEGLSAGTVNRRCLFFWRWRGYLLLGRMP